jgi:hypothetical protein
MVNELRNDRGKFAPKPNIKRCLVDGCGTRVRNSGNFCEKHIDWSEHAHPKSILSDEDLIFIKEHLDTMDDLEIAISLSDRSHHTNHSTKQVLSSMRNFRRRKLLKRRFKGRKGINRGAKISAEMPNSPYYIKHKYRAEHKKCEFCGWQKCPCDIHHILPKKHFHKDEIAKFHAEQNLLMVCPNHHRECETLKRTAWKIYLEISVNKKIFISHFNREWENAQ